jgi:acetolactate synthase I/II/III large subunit
VNGVPSTAVRNGGHVVIETLESLGTEIAFGVPGVHALAIWNALRTSDVRAVVMRTELAAGFAADGYARSANRPAPLLLSTGPGALNSLTAIMEAASSHVPVVAISSQIPRELIGRGRGYLHELPDQLAVFAPLVKLATRAPSASAIPEVLAEAWRIARTPPSGPVYVEIPVDVLTGEADAPAISLEAEPAREVAGRESLEQAAQLLSGARRPVIWAGGGVVRSGAGEELRALAERLDAPVATTYMGKGAIADDHPLAVGCGCDEAAFQELLSEADVVLCVGTELGAETTGQYNLRLSGRLIQLDAAPERIGTTYPALALVGDAKATLGAILGVVPARQPEQSDARARVAAVRSRIRRGLEAQGRDTELASLSAIERALPANAISAWDMTILGYWAAPHLRIGEQQTFMYPLGSGTLGYAWPAAIGASLAHPDRTTLAVVGDGGLHYALGELASARQHNAAAKLLLVDDGGYGILREYQRQAYGETTAVDLVQPDFAAVAQAFGVPVRTGSRETLEESLAWAFSVSGPAMVVVKELLVAAQPTR